MSFQTVKIERHLQDVPVFVFLPVDEAASLAIPVIFGMMAKQLLIGIVIGFALWTIWKKVKGKDGLPGVAARAYFFLPAAVSGFKGFPDSGVVTWRC